jgi:hypothetical protein
MYSTKKNNNERSEIIPISNTYSHKFNKIKNKYDEYGLNKHFFDPSKSSPPNNFIIKLQTRMNNFR